MLHRPAVGQYRWHLDQLVIVRDDDRLRCGHVVHVALDSRDQLTVGIKLWPGAPTAIAVRALTTMLVEETPIPTVILGATPDEKPAMLVPPRTFNPGRVFRTIASGPERRVRLTRLLQRGADFERVAFDEIKS
jgi:hypothetical protein